MARRPFILFVLAVLALVGFSAWDVSASADPPPTVITLTMNGSQTYGVTSIPAFFDAHPQGGFPAGISIDQWPSCTRLTTGQTIPADLTLQTGTYTIDPASCSGATFKGPGAAGYTAAYAAGPFVVVRRFPPNPVASVTGMLTSVRTGKVTYTARFTLAGAVPAAGIATVFGLGPRTRTQCSAVTDAQGVATCTLPRRAVTVAGTPFYVWTNDSTNYLASFQAYQFKVPFS
ncbi:hypothetical protein [Nocardioides marmorisolisilvae]|uniref:Uncharacterized protein n=1 Tax=Nocardioides marmorisolisilvae TaxID=1542737 RepID=A0A3N0DTG8_9ACTN|nr:hypothetical protein [Nocardioides marmorisolisilvae]RNL78934.1 hypothetical protein EFL95_07745 [Nocardioides marmorisolisilvae]